MINSQYKDNNITIDSRSMDKVNHLPSSARERSTRSGPSVDVREGCRNIYPSSSFEFPLTQIQNDKAVSPVLGLNIPFTNNYYAPQLNSIIQPFGRGTGFDRASLGFRRGAGVWNTNHIEPYYDRTGPVLNNEKNIYGVPLHASNIGDRYMPMMDATVPTSTPWEHWTRNLINSTSSSIECNNIKPLQVKSTVGDDNKRLYIDQIHNLDVLCGRGGRSNHHFGNKVYRQVVSDMKMNYKSIDGKKGKTNLSRAIVDHVIGYGGRFVKKEDSTGNYYLLSHTEARRKTSQALREIKEIKWTV